MRDADFNPDRHLYAYEYRNPPRRDPDLGICYICGEETYNRDADVEEFVCRVCQKWEETERLEQLVAEFEERREAAC